MEARPASGRSRPVVMRRVVDLPAPFGPTSPKKAPAGTTRLRSTTAGFRPKDLRRPSMRTAGGSAGALAAVVTFRRRCPSTTGPTLVLVVVRATGPVVTARLSGPGSTRGWAASSPPQGHLGPDHAGPLVPGRQRHGRARRGPHRPFGQGTIEGGVGAGAEAAEHAGLEDPSGQLS